MRKAITLTISAVILTGCNHLTVSGFDRSELSAVSGSKAGLVVQNTPGTFEPGTPLANYNITHPKLNAKIAKVCKPVPDLGPQMVSPVVIPLVAAIGKLVFDLQMDKSTRELEKLKKAATGTYSQTVVMSADEFNGQSCAIIYRYDEKSKAMGFIAVVDINRHADAFTIKPVYVKAYNTVAITRKPENDDKQAKINASIGVAVKAIGKDKTGLPILSTLGAGVVTMPNISLMEKGVNACADPCASSELVPVTSGSGTVSVTFSVVETGKLGVDFDEEIAERKAIKEAIGPAISAAITAHYAE